MSPPPRLWWNASSPRTLIVRAFSELQEELTGGFLLDTAP